VKLPEFREGVCRDINHGASDLSLCAGRPTGGGDGDLARDRRCYASAGRAALPGMRDRPFLEVNVLELILAAEISGPIGGRVQGWRTGKAAADRVGEVFEVGHDLIVVADLLKDALVGGGQIGL